MALKNLFGTQKASSSCGSACGTEDKKEAPSACGAEDKKEAPSACGSACGAGDKN